MNPPRDTIPGILEFPVHDVSRYRDLLRSAPASIACPVRLGADVVFGATFALRGSIVPRSPQDILAAWSPSPCPPCPPGCTCLEPFAMGFPTELVRVGAHDRSLREETVRAAGELSDGLATYSRMALVGADRPADVPSVVGWAGVLNYPHQDLMSLGTVLRSWEERFGAVLVYLGRCTLMLAVADPPTTPEEADRVAAEHFSFCPDQSVPRKGTVHTPRTYARTIIGRGVWRFSWG